MNEVDIVSIILDSGTVGLMAVFLWAFMTGRIMSKQTHIEIVKKLCESHEKSLEILGSELVKTLGTEVRKAVKDGYVEGYFEVNEKDKENKK